MNTSIYLIVVCVKSTFCDSISKNLEKKYHRAKLTLKILLSHREYYHPHF